MSHFSNERRVYLQKIKAKLLLVTKDLLSPVYSSWLKLFLVMKDFLTKEDGSWRESSYS